ncbi:MAG: YggS family pyridoxal phosphate-dependent enzyme [Myxococcales bacterium]|nr:MAG: YggS family pyridoxal phosphate-dependent enzyme [Myxococcales bacterium]
MDRAPAGGEAPGASDDSIAARLAQVRARLARAESAAGRGPGAVRLLAVSKLQPASALREAYAAGQLEFGENYPQELASKAAELADLPGLALELIGHLQSNKARLVAPLTACVHTVDSASLARELGKRAAGRPSPLAVLVEVNVGGEAQKHGCAPGDLATVLTAIEAEPALRLAGLMTVPPATDDPADARPFFRQLRELRDAHGGPARLPELSMGMSHDLEAAVAEGATVVRVGTAIFGARPAR